ncbi:MAG: S8 family serine peptidase [Gemmatimonadaceae bacterium]
MRRLLVLVLGAVILAACYDSPVEITRAPTPRLSAASSSASRYVLLFRGSPPADFAATVAAAGGTLELLHAGAGIAIVGGLSVDNALALERSGGVEAMVEDFEYQGVFHRVEPMIEQADLASTEVSTQSQANPATAFFFPRQWHHRAIGANVAWAAGRLGSPNVDVAILDTGVDHLYPDLVGLVDQGRARSFVPEGSLTPPFPTDQRLLRDNQLLEIWFPGSGRPIWSDLNGHGSHVASTVSSLAIVSAGVTSRVTIIPVKVLAARGSGSFTGILNGILYATDAGAEVINMSLGALYPRAGNRAFNRVLDEVTMYARKAGVTIVVAAGNDAARLHPSNGGLYGAFCSTKNVICVSATGPNAGPVNGPYTPGVDFRAIYTNYGIQFIDVAAPGGNWAENAQGQIVSAIGVWAACSKTRLQFVVPRVPPGSPEGTLPAPPFYRKNICSLNPNLTFASGFIGTSMASPHVAGLVALLVEQVGRSPETIKSILTEMSDDIVEFGKPGKDDFYGNGRINVPRALGL